MRIPAGQAERIAADRRRHVDSAQERSHEQIRSGRVATIDQRDCPAIKQVVVVGIKFGVKTAGGNFKCEGRMALLQKEASESAGQLRTFAPYVTVIGRAAEGEQVQHLCALLRDLLEDCGRGRCGHEGHSLQRNERTLRVGGSVAESTKTAPDRFSPDENGS